MTVRHEDNGLEIGQRVRLSPLGKSRMLRGKGRVGKVLGFGMSPRIVRVQFEDLNGPVSLHQTYIEIAKPNQRTGER